MVDFAEKVLEKLMNSLPQEASKRERKKKSEEEEAKRSSFLVYEGKLYEQVARDGTQKFFEYDPQTGEITELSLVKAGKEVVLPNDSDDVVLGAVKLPTGIEEYGTLLHLLEEVQAHIHRYLDVSPAFEKLATYYVLLSWVYDRFHTIPYLRALGDTGCGKSRFLDVIGGLCYKPIFASGCVTPAPIYRMLQKWGGTLILDEADFRDSSEYSEVVTILNCGFERGRPVIRAVKDNPEKLQVFEVFGPKVFATRNRFKDPALEARCLTEVMTETERDDIPPDLGATTFFREEVKLRNKLLLFRFRNYLRINYNGIPQVSLSGLEPRLKQISSAFLSLLAGDERALEEYVAFIHQHQKELIEQRASTPVGQVVVALLSTATNVTTVTDVTGELLLPISCKMLEEITEIKNRTVGQILKNLGLRTKLARIGGKVQHYVVYDPQKLKLLARRYLPDEACNVCSVCNDCNGTQQEEVEEVIWER